MINKKFNINLTEDLKFILCLSIKNKDNKINIHCHQYDKFYVYYVYHVISNKTMCITPARFYKYKDFISCLTELNLIEML